MLIAQISDLHLPPAGRLTLDHVDTAAALARIITHVNALSPRPDLAIVTGDLTNDGSAAEAAHARSLLERLACPWVILPGNHDRRAVLRATFSDDHLPLDETAGGFLCYRLELGGLDLIALDSVDEGAPGGRLCDGRRAWLDRALAGAEGRAKLLFMHHPPAVLGVPETDRDGFRGAAGLARMVARAEALLMVGAGHIHLPTSTLWQGTKLVTVPSTAMELTRDFSADPPASRFVRSAPGYGLHFLTRQRRLVSHTVTLPDDARSYPFAPLAGTSG